MKNRELLQAIVDDADNDFSNVFELRISKGQQKKTRLSFSFAEKTNKIPRPNAIATFTGKISDDLFQSGGLGGNTRFTRPDMRGLGYFYYLMAKVRQELEILGITKISVTTNEIETVLFFNQLSGQDIAYERKPITIEVDIDKLPTVEEAKANMLRKMQTWLDENPPE
jgi:hypothetical protein